MRRKRSQSMWKARHLVAAGAVFVIALAAGTYGTDVASQLAQAGSVNIGAPQTCGEAKQRALSGEKLNDGPAKGGITGTKEGKTELDKCYSAFMTEEGMKKKQKGQKLSDGDYKCYGRQAVTTVKTGSVSDVSVPSKGAAEGKCNRSVNSEKPKSPMDPKQEKPKGDEKKEGGAPPMLPMPPKPEGGDKGGGGESQPCQKGALEAAGKANPDQECKESVWDKVFGRDKDVEGSPTPQSRSFFERIGDFLGGSEPADKTFPLDTLKASDFSNLGENIKQLTGDKNIEVKQSWNESGTGLPNATGFSVSATQNTETNSCAFMFFGNCLWWR